MPVYEINPLTDPRWNDLATSHPGASVFHSRPWLEALSHSYGYEPAALTTTAPGQALQNGIVFCRIKSSFTGSRIVSLPFSDHCQPLVSTAGDLTELIQHLKETVTAQGWNYLELRPVEDIGPEAPMGLAPSSLFCIHKLDLRPDENALFRNCHKSCVQRKIQRAQRDALTIEEGRSDRLLTMFYDLLLLTRRRHQLPPQPLTWFQNLIHSFGENLTIRVAFKDQQPVASMLTLLHRKTLTYKYGCSDARFHNLGGMPFLFWRVIQEAKKQGAEELDFGRSETDNPGLIAFKDHWGGVRAELKYYRYSLRPSGKAARPWRLDATRRAFSLLPDVCLKTAGTILYKHIG